MTRNLLELWVHILMEFRLIYMYRGCGLVSFSLAFPMCVECTMLLEVLVLCSVLRFVPLTR